MTLIRMQPPAGTKSISQGRFRAVVGDDGHAMIPLELVDDAVSHGWRVSHLQRVTHVALVEDGTQPDQATKVGPLMKPAMPGDGAAFDLPLKKMIVAPAATPPRKAEGKGKRQK